MYMLPRLVSQSTRRPFFYATCAVHVAGYKEHVVINEKILPSRNLHTQHSASVSLIKRYKHDKKKASKAQHDDSDEEEDNEEADENADSTSKTITANVNSLRLDVIIKTGLGMARNKIEAAFYESRIRLNGQKVYKKSMQVSVGDEIDIVLRKSIDNPNFLVVNRTVLLSVQDGSGGFNVRLSKDKSLLIENYDEVWQGEEV